MEYGKPAMGSIYPFSPIYLDQVVKLANRSMDEYYTRNLIYDIWKNWPEKFFIYQVDRKKIAGFICGSKYTATVGRVLLLAVDERYRRMGIGNALMRTFIDTCRRDRLLSIRLEVKTTNTGAIQFYRNLGFVITSTLFHYYSDSSNAYLMWRMI